MPDVLTDTLTVPAAAARRRSIRAFDPRPIPAEELDAILDVVRLAPSAFNVQPWRFVVVRSPEVKARLAGAAYNQRQVTAAPAVLVLYTDTADALATVDEVIHPGLTGEQREKARAGILAAFAGRSAEAVEDWGAAQGHIALGYLLLAAEAHGYQTSPMAGFDAEAVKTLLDLPAHVRVPALVAIGRGAETGFSHHRQPLARLVRAA